MPQIPRVVGDIPEVVVVLGVRCLRIGFGGIGGNSRGVTGITRLRFPRNPLGGIGGNCLGGDLALVESYQALCCSSLSVEGKGAGGDEEYQE